jgi:hypothetical protein
MNMKRTIISLGIICGLMAMFCGSHVCAQGQPATDSIEKMLQKMRGEKPNYNALVSLFGMSTNLPNMELRNQAMKTCGAGMLLTGSNQFYSSNIRAKIPQITEFENSLYAPCSTCNGTGKIHRKCPRCNGSKNCVSPMCNTGHVTYKGFNGNVTSGTCPVCRGNGKCQNCRGTGEVDAVCPTCRQRGTVYSLEQVAVVYNQEFEMFLTCLHSDQVPGVGIDLVTQQRTANASPLATLTTIPRTDETVPVSGIGANAENISASAAVSIVVSSGVGLDADKAMKDALRNAVQQAVGAIVDAETLIKNENIIKDQILTYSDGYVEHIDGISETKRADGLIEVRVKATVKRRQLVEKLQTSKIIATKVDGQSLFAELATQLDASKNATKLLEKALDGLPLNLLVARVADQKPKIESMSGNEVTASWDLQVFYDYRTYTTKVVPSLKRTLESIAKRRGGTDYFESYKNAINYHGFYGTLTAPISKFVFWSGYDKTPLPEQFGSSSWNDGTEVVLLLHVNRDGGALKDRMAWYILDRDCLPVISAVQACVPKLRIALLDNGKQALHEDEIDFLEMRTCMLLTGGRKPEIEKFSLFNSSNELSKGGCGRFPWFVTSWPVWDRTERKRKRVFLIAPLIRVEFGTQYSGYVIEFKWTRKFGLEEIKNISEIRCSFTDVVTEKRRR